MILAELIDALEAADPEQVVPVGFGNPHSYRGYYDELAFEPVPNVTVGAMLAAARGALGETFWGWKGGDYQMGPYTETWLAWHGREGESIGPVLLSYMLGAPTMPRNPWKG